MTIFSKTLLAVAVIGLMGGIIIDFAIVNPAPEWTVVLPAGAIAFGMFLISLALEKEVAQYDAEQVEKLQRLQRTTRRDDSTFLK